MTPHAQPWSVLLDRSRTLPGAADVIAKLLSDARIVLALPVAERLYKLEDIGIKGRSWLDPRYAGAADDLQETYGLAHSDVHASGIASREITLLASAYRLTHDDVFAERAVKQLAEMQSWYPIQRSGWNLLTKEARLPPDGKSGSWLATGQGIEAIVNGLELLPEDQIPTDIADALRELLKKEIADIADDWATGRTWFIQDNNAITNQWILPTAGLVLACLHLGREKYPEEYALGVRNLRQSVESHNDQGAFEEGFAYAGSVGSLFKAVYAMSMQGDTGLMCHPFLQNFGTWYVHHCQPGGFIINAFDCNSGGRRSVQPGGPSGLGAELLALIALCTGNPDARWALKHLCAGPPPSPVGLAAAALPPLADGYQPVCFASYDSARRVNWRSSWDWAASGVWIRGGHEKDQHDCIDRGHVNFIRDGKPILIEAGTSFYDNPRLSNDYASGAGHNILQIGREPVPEGGNARMKPPAGWQMWHTIAPLKTIRLDATGGEVEVDPSAGYPDIEQWRRRVKWSAQAMSVADTVVMAARPARVCLFRWHLGTREDVAITGGPDRWTIAWPDATIRISADAALVLTQVKMPDHTLEYRIRDWAKPDVDAYHTCIVVQTQEEVSSLGMTTTICVEHANRSRPRNGRRE